METVSSKALRGEDGGVVKAGFTKGPWSVEPPTMGFSQITGPNGELIFGLAAGLPEEKQHDAICEANARLIAAAPEMYGSLQGTLKLLRKAQDVLTMYLHPDSYDADHAVNLLLELLDGPEQRAIETQARAALAKVSA